MRLKSDDFGYGSAGDVKLEGRGERRLEDTPFAVGSGRATQNRLSSVSFSSFEEQSAETGSALCHLTYNDRIRFKNSFVT